MTLDFCQSFSVREGLRPSKLPSGSLSLRLDTDFSRFLTTLKTRQLSHLLAWAYLPTTKRLQAKEGVALEFE
jgi:hypothetical protein